jgi:arylsulfatase A-like enzyme
VCLAIALVITKATYVQLSTFWGGGPASLYDFFRWDGLPSWIAAVSRSDLIFAVAAGFIAQLLFKLVAPYSLLSRIYFIAFIIFGVICVEYAIVSREVFSYFGSQLSFQLLNLGGDPEKLASSISPFITRQVVIAIVIAPLLFLLVSWLMYLILRDVSPVIMRIVYATTLCIIIFWLWLGFQLENRDRWFSLQDKYFIESPHITMLESVFFDILGIRTNLLSIKFPEEDINDFNIPVRTNNHTEPFFKELQNRPLKNVILIVLESVGSHYLTVYDKASNVTPRLAAEARNAIIFDNYYSPVGWTAYAMTSILYAIQPPIKRYNTTNFTLNRFSIPSVAAILKERGYSTVFMASGDPHWASKGILDSDMFDVIRTGRELTHAKDHTSWGVRDEYLFQDIREFINENNEKPFFLLAWTDQTHHPYKMSKKEEKKNNGGKERYLKIIKEVDKHIGKLFDFLRDKQLSNDTLVIITGDHGEAFGKLHGTSGHGFTVYDEEVKVPLILWNPRLFKQEYRLPTVGSHVDLAPTILDLLGESIPTEWHGTSLFMPERSPRSYFFAAAWGKYLLGVREDEWKYIVDARLGTEEFYNLQNDPDEQNNRASEYPQHTLRLRKRLAAMLQFNEVNYAWMDSENE